MTPFTERVLRVLNSVPEGRVMTYGGVAKAAGSPRGARQVARILHSMSRKHNLPWHRIVNAEGKIVIQENDNQAELLMTEGIPVRNGRVDLEEYGWAVDEMDFI